MKAPGVSGRRWTSLQGRGGQDDSGRLVLYSRVKRVGDSGYSMSVIIDEAPLYLRVKEGSELSFGTCPYAGYAPRQYCRYCAEPFEGRRLHSSEGLPERHQAIVHDLQGHE